MPETMEPNKATAGDPIGGTPTPVYAGFGSGPSRAKLFIEGTLPILLNTPAPMTEKEVEAKYADAPKPTAKFISYGTKE